MSPDQPPTTNQPELFVPEVYVSLRINIPEDEFDYLRDKVLHDLQYVAYPHRGSNGVNAHFHVFIPAPDGKKFAERIRKRLRTCYTEKGNGFYSVKFQSNGLLSAIQYGSKEGTKAFSSDEEMLRCVQLAPPWVDRGTGQTNLSLQKADRTERDWQLTYSNLVCQAVQHARRNKLTVGLKHTVQHMLEHSRWRPSHSLVQNGVPDFYHRDYEFRLGKRSHQDMDWFAPKMR